MLSTWLDNLLRAEIIQNVKRKKKKKKKNSASDIDANIVHPAGATFVQYEPERRKLRGKRERESETYAHTHQMRHKTRQLAKKSVKPGINNPSPQMPSIVPCLDKVSKSGWKMQAPFLSVWNYYPFVLSQALLSSTSCACADVSE